MSQLWKLGYRVLVPAGLLLLAAGLAASVLFAAPRKPPSPLGAAAAVSGGVARINGVIPLEADNWTPPSGAPGGGTPALAGPPGDGVHRVRILVELTALDRDGLSYDPSHFAVSGLGTAKWPAVWSSSGPLQAPQGHILNATLVFELPDKAIDLVLETQGGSGLSLGKGHHRG